MINIRSATQSDLPMILSIYNQGIEDRIATLETEIKDLEYMEKWFENHDDRFHVKVAEQDGIVVGWASLNRYSARTCYDAVGDLSIYIHREYRGQGVGRMLLDDLETSARQKGFHKIILFTFPFNELGQGLYRKQGFREVGIFREQGMLDGKYVDVLAMEKLLV